MNKTMMALLLSCSSWYFGNVYAGQEDSSKTGNGGDVVICPTQAKGYSYEMLDAHEGNGINLPGGTVRAKVSMAVNRLKKYSPRTASAIGEEALKIARDLDYFYLNSEHSIIDLNRQARYLNFVDQLEEVYDSYEKFVNSNCSVKQLAIRTPNHLRRHENEPSYRVQIQLLRRLDMDNLAVFALHESMYLWTGNKNSVGARGMVDYVASGWIEEDKLEKYTKTIDSFIDQGEWRRNFDVAANGYVFSSRHLEFDELGENVVKGIPLEGQKLNFAGQEIQIGDHFFDRLVGLRSADGSLEYEYLGRATFENGKIVAAFLPKGTVIKLGLDSTVTTDDFYTRVKFDYASNAIYLGSGVYQNKFIKLNFYDQWFSLVGPVTSIQVSSSEMTYRGKRLSTTFGKVELYPGGELKSYRTRYMEWTKLSNKDVGIEEDSRIELYEDGSYKKFKAWWPFHRQYEDGYSVSVRKADGSKVKIKRNMVVELSRTGEVL